MQVGLKRPSCSKMAQDGPNGGSRAPGLSLFEGVGCNIVHFGSMMHHARAIRAILGQLYGIRGQHGIIMAHLGSSMGLCGEQLAVA